MNQLKIESSFNVGLYIVPIPCYHMLLIIFCWGLGLYYIIFVCVLCDYMLFPVKPNKHI